MISMTEHRPTKAKGSFGSLRTIGLSLQSKVGAKTATRPARNFSSVINTIQIGNASIHDSPGSILRGEKYQQLTERLFDLGETIEDQNSFLENQEKAHLHQPSFIPNISTTRNAVSILKSPKLARKIQLRLNTVPTTAIKNMETPAQSQMKRRSVSLQFPLSKNPCSLTPKINWAYVKQIEGDVDQVDEHTEANTSSSISIKGGKFQAIKLQPVGKGSNLMKIRVNQKTLAFEQNSLSQKSVSNKEKPLPKTSERHHNAVSLIQGSENKFSSNPFFKTESVVSRCNGEQTSIRKLSGVSFASRVKPRSNQIHPDESSSSYGERPISIKGNLQFFDPDYVGKSFADDPSFQDSSLAKATSHHSKKAIDTVVDLAKLLEKNNPFQEFLVTKQSGRFYPT